MTERELPKRGDIWLIDWYPSRGSEQAGIRPALVVQTDAANSNPGYPNTIVLALSTKGKPLPFHIQVMPEPGNGLTEISFIKCEQVLTIAKGRLVRKLGNVSEDTLRLVNRAIRLVLEIN